MKITLIVLLLLIVAAIAGIFVLGPDLTGNISSFKHEPTGTAVRVMPTARQTLIETVKAPGEIEPHTKVDISAQVSARIEQLPFEEGDEVKQGDIVARLDDADLQKALESAVARQEAEEFRLRSQEAQLKGTMANLNLARTELERMKQLFDAGDVSQRELDSAQRDVDDLEASVESSKFIISNIESTLTSSKAEVDRARESLSKTVITAPMDGEIIALNVEVGEQVLGTLSNVGTVLMTIADRSRMILKAEVAESDIAGVTEDQSARIYINAYPDIVFSGTVTKLSLQREMSSDGTGIFRTDIEIDLQGRRILSGLAANVDIEIAEHEGLVVESQAIVERLVEELPEEIRLTNPLVDRARRTTSVVYRLVNGKSVCTPVRPGPSDLTHTLVHRGLEEGQQIIVGPYKVLEKIKDDEAYYDEAAAIENATEQLVNDADASADVGPATADAGDEKDEA